MAGYPKRWVALSSFNMGKRGGLFCYSRWEKKGGMAAAFHHKRGVFLSQEEVGFAFGLLPFNMGEINVVMWPCIGWLFIMGREGNGDVTWL